jgi:hypothetical protein
MITSTTPAHCAADTLVSAPASPGATQPVTETVFLAVVSELFERLEICEYTIAELKAENDQLTDSIANLQEAHT